MTSGSLVRPSRYAAPPLLAVLFGTAFVSGVFAIDSGNDRIEQFTDTGDFLTTWGSLGNADVQFNSATAVAVDPNGTVLVTDENHRVQRFACPPPGTR